MAKNMFKQLYVNERSKQKEELKKEVETVALVARELNICVY